MLTPKQSAFVTEYLIDLNATKAATRAGYSAKTANQQGPRLLENVGVKAAIDAAKSRRSLETGVDARWVLRRLVAESEADLKDLFDANNDLKPVAEWPPLWREGLVQSVEIEALYEGTGKSRIQVGETKKLRLSDRLRRVELIGKHVQVNAFQESIQHQGLEGLGDRLERAFARDREDAFNRKAMNAPVIEVLPSSEAPGAESLKLAEEAGKRYLDRPRSPVPLAIEAKPELATQPAPPLEQAQPRYEPIWPAEQEFVQADYDVIG